MREEKKGQCNADPEDSAYASGYRDGYNDARSDMTVDPVAECAGGAMNKCRGSDEMGSDYTHLRAEPEKTTPARDVPSRFVPHDWFELEGLAIPGGHFESEAEAYAAGIEIISYGLDDSHFPKTFRVVKYTSLSRNP